MHVNVLVLGEVFDPGLSAVLDAFQTANELIELSGSRFRALRCELWECARASKRPRVEGSRECDPIARAGLRGRSGDRDLKRPIHCSAPYCGPMSAIPRPSRVIGTFVLAESGLFDRDRATTTWWLAPLLRKRYPTAELGESNMIVKSGRFVTAGAALSHMDLVLWLIRGVSPRLAALTAKCLIVDSPSIAIRLRTDRSSGPFRSSGTTFRNLGARAAPAGFLSRSRCRGRRVQQANARAAPGSSTRRIVPGLFSKPPRRARRSLAENYGWKYWRCRRTRRLP